ncbi:DUF1934 domain-containing protein [Alkalihalobacillus hemicellulosilyticus]|uniref:DUF1934 domain-containing protein n=1 Tax=Halalkalibacter hemicellulosilyticusJCM 9152 TaxID=1236971 RepID=W4QIV5_9BACI|nr:DUF1934 family protein [Halalkalibacter hemicellulosilyticus]GAE31269.1 hypothetical protein JCM9152_2726 [Halalkalibacter hemicellulosilyticusJCM 9152]
MKKALKRFVKIRFQTKVEQHDHTDTNDFTTRGEIFHKGSQDYLRFEEAIPGFEKVQTTMKWDGHELMLIRQGTVLMRQAFVAGERTLGRYVTQEASWETEAITEKVLVQWPRGKTRGRIEICYQFLLQGQETGRHYVRLTLEEE